MITATAWCRVDLAGGTLDIWPLGLLHQGSRTLCVAVDLPVTVQVEEAARGGYSVEQGENRVVVDSAEELQARPETALIGLVAEALNLPPSRWKLESASPRGGGLGASSALTVAAIRAGERLLGKSLPAPAKEVAGLARDLEARLMALPTGTQDHYAALLGGALSLSYPAGGVAVRPLASVDLDALADRLVVVYTGQSHFSAGNNWQVVRRRLDGDPEMVRLFDGIARTAAELESALEAGNWQAVGRLMAQEWSYRRRLAPEVSTEVVEELLASATKMGAWGGKACGAGGGGCLAVLCPSDCKEDLKRSFTDQGFAVLGARPTREPLQLS